MPCTILIKYLLVIFKSGGYPLWAVVFYSMSSAYYTLVFNNKPFPNLLFYQILLYRLHLTTHVNNLVIHPYSPSCNFTWVFDLECHCQTSVKVELMFWLLFMKFRKLASTEKMKSWIPVKLRYFHCLSHALFYEPVEIGHKLFSNKLIYKLLKIV